MIPLRLRITLLLALLVFFLILMSMLKKRILDLKYTLLWLLTWAVLLVMTIWPQILGIFLRIAGIQANMNGLYILLIGFMMMLLLSLTSITSGQKEKIKILAEANALLEHRVRLLENELKTRRIENGMGETNDDMPWAREEDAEELLCRQNSEKSL